MYFYSELTGKKISKAFVLAVQEGQEASPASDLTAAVAGYRHTSDMDVYFSIHVSFVSFLKTEFYFAV